jgi:hypothetical protein
VANAGDERSLAHLSGPFDRFVLCLERAKDVIGMVFNDVIVDGASFRPALGAGPIKTFGMALSPWTLRTSSARWITGLM